MQVKKHQPTITAQALAPPNKAVNDYDWDVVDEYDPFWPNEYEKLIKERRDRRDSERKRRNNRNDNNSSSSSPANAKYSGFGFSGRSDDADNYNKSPPSRSGGATSMFNKFIKIRFHFKHLF